MKVAILGAGDPIGASLARRLIDQGVEVVSSDEVTSTRISTKHLDGLDELGRVIEHKLHNNFLGDVVVIPRKPRESRTYEPRRQTGAARIKRNAKQRRRRKGK